MSRPFGLSLATLCCTLALTFPVSAETHPCTGASLPLTTEGAVGPGGRNACSTAGW